MMIRNAMPKDFEIIRNLLVVEGITTSDFFTKKKYEEASKLG